MKYYNLKTNKYIEINDSSKGLSFLYDNLFGRIILKIMTSKWIANVYACYMNSSLSKHKIKKFISKNHINMDEYENKEYKSFNDFFMRKIKSDKRPVSNGLYAIADSKLTAYPITDDLSFEVKNSIYTVSELIGSETDAKKYDGGYALIFRLCVDDYHHYIFPDEGKFIKSKVIKGKLHTVQPIALKKYKVFTENTRIVTELDTKHYGNVSYIEVGAMMIGKIVNEPVKEFTRAQEKGHFEFGGSTIILLFKKDQIKLNKDILENTRKDIETIVKMGESLE